MGESDTRSGTDDFDFDTAYRDDSPFGARAPWDIDGPQPAFVALEQTAAIAGDVLDCGCGSGENVLFLATKGHTVTGVDLAPTAISIAQKKARERGLTATFTTADALELTGYHDQFDTVIDSALAHLFDPDQLTRYAAALHRACRVDATVHILGISDRAFTFLRNEQSAVAEQLENQLPSDALKLEDMLPSLTADHLRNGFAAGWAAESITETTLRTFMPFQTDPLDLPARLGRFRRLASKTDPQTR
ncbi:class I SAM-dependent methyltransferase [Nocardia altamirensis]|uniref:class I SAM-dependent methyltransferase n=1 Tax=Nocardia altamirensis TaxID=472158 RepID=UPI0008400630|nr:class I SAM-dependent methyltransferase [Nocardia altamirensis]